MMLVLRKILFLLVLSYTHLGMAQNFVWNKVVGDSGTVECEGVFSSTRKNCTYLFARSTGLNGDTSKLKIGDTLIKGDQNQNHFLLKLDLEGNLIKSKVLPTFIESMSVMDDEFGNIYLFLDINFYYYKDSLKIVNDAPYFKINSSVGKLFILKLDSNFGFKKYIGLKRPSREVKKSLYNIIDNTLFFTDSKSKVGSVNVNLDTSTIKYLNWHFPQKSTPYLEYNIASILDFNDSLLLVCTGFLPDTLLGLPTFMTGNNECLYTLVVSKDFTSAKIDIISDTAYPINMSYFESFVLNKNNLVIATNFWDSLNLRNKVVLRTKQSQLEPLLMIFDGNALRRHFFFQESKKDVFFGTFHNIAFDGSFIYTAGLIDGEITTLNSPSNNANGNFFYSKIDSLGNLLWFFRTGSFSSVTRPRSLALDSNRALYTATTFLSSISINNQQFRSNYGSKDFLLSKIYDFSITRGAVGKGPYCAGDTFLIPYTKDGTFAGTNTFIAELSDEEGNFTGNHRVLGKLKTNRDSTIKGVLPLFDVVSSPNYRIRIISTAPLVQSYYRYDSLRLLIYSKDTAYIGKDTQICPNKPMQLKVTGGTAWHWSPGQLVNDSHSRTPMLLGLQNTQPLRAIIADSSGCGQQDTAYIKISVFDKIKVQNKDTILCPNSSLAALVQGGDNNNYIYRWHDMDSNKLLSTTAQITTHWQGTKNIKLWVTDSCFTQADSINFMVSVYDSIRIQNPKDTSICSGFPYSLYPDIKGGGSVFLVNFAGQASNTNPYIISNKTDSLVKLTVQGVCNFIDTAMLHFTFYDKFTTPKPLSDTVLCLRQTLTLSNPPQSGQYQNKPSWSFGNNAVVADTLRQSFTQNESIVFAVQNQCGVVYRDTFLVILRNALKLNGPKDTTVCLGGLVNFKYSVSGGLNPKIDWYSQNWQGKNTHRTSIDTTLVLNQDSIVFLVAYDDCTAKNDTLKTVIYYFDSIKTKIIVNPYCYKDSLVLSSSATGGKPAANLQYTWQLNGSNVGFTSPLTLQNISYQRHQLILTVKDNCSADATDSFAFHPNPKAKFAVNNASQCFGSQDFVLTNTSQFLAQDSVQIEWQFPAGWQQDSSEANKVFGKFSSTGNYKIGLKTVAKNGCIDIFEAVVTVKASEGISMFYTRTKNNNNQSSDWEFSAHGNDFKNMTWYIDGVAYLNNTKAVHTFKDTGHFTIRFTYTDRFGCPNDTNFLAYILHDLQFYIPTGISANADQLNDVFNFVGKEYVAKYDVKIFNRWGEMLFKSKDVNEMWQPKSKTTENYIYIINITDIFNVDHQLHGTIVVVK